MDRLGFLTKHFSLAGKDVLEFGALSSPLIPSGLARLSYIDHLDTEGLRQKYLNDPAVDKEKLVHVSHVWNRGRFSSVIGDEIKYDLLVACHVFEHFPNPIQWLLDAQDVLRPGGAVFLVLPDRRFTFDMMRRDSNLSDWMGWYLHSLSKPSAAMVYDHFANVRNVSAHEAWYRPDYDAPAVMHGHAMALELAMSVLKPDNYVDVHCSVFTPYSFVGLCAALDQVDLFPFRFAAIQPTEPDEMEFAVLLERSDRSGRKQIDNETLQSLARSAGYQGAFGKGGFAAALETNPQIRQSYEDLITDWNREADREFNAGRSLPDLDPVLHHMRPTAGDPRLTRLIGRKR